MTVTIYKPLQDLNKVLVWLEDPSWGLALQANPTLRWWSALKRKALLGWVHLSEIFT